jgi:hypothetical protein
MMSNIEDILLILVIGALIGSCTYQGSESARLRVCVEANMEYVNGDCISKRP